MRQLFILPILLILMSCGNSNKVKMSNETEQKTTVIYPSASDFSNSPLRNRMVLELNKPVSIVYDLVGDPTNMSKYSAGLEKVETEMKNGKCISYTCYFKPMTEGEEGVIHTEKLVWQETNLGWASAKKEATDFGFTDSFSLTTLVEKGDKTILKWDMHFNHDNAKMLIMNKTTLVDVFNDMANQLIAKFGGKLIENYMGPTQ